MKKPTRTDLEAALRHAAAGKAPARPARPSKPLDDGVTLEKLARAFSKANARKTLQ